MNTCTKESPMPKDDNGRWIHPDAVEISTDYESAYGSYDEYKCPHCGKRFWVELPD